MKRLLIIMTILFMFCVPTFAENVKEIDMLSCRIDLGVGKYDETKIILDIRDSDGNTFTNVYSIQQIQRSNRDYSYLIDGSNCVYLIDAEYQQVRDDKNATFWVWFIFLGCVCAVLLYFQS